MKPKPIYYLFLGILLISSFSLTLAQQPPICLNPSGHLIWPNQTKNYIPYLSGKDNVSNSPINIKDGNIGIGTLSPSSKLDIEGNARVSEKFSAGNTNIFGNLTSTGDITPKRLCLDGVCRTNWSFEAKETDPLIKIWAKIGNPLNIEENLNITSNNRLGIGTTDPQTSLDIQGNARISGNTSINSIYIGQGLNSNQQQRILSDGANQSMRIFSPAAIFLAPMNKDPIAQFGGEIQPESQSIKFFVNPEGNTNAYGNFTSTGDVKGTRLCIGADCRSNWPASETPPQPPESGWEWLSGTNVIRTISKILNPTVLIQGKNPKFQMKDENGKIILEISEE